MYSLILTSINQESEEIDIDLSFIDSSLIDIVWCGEDTDSDDNVIIYAQSFKVLILSSKGSIYRSFDKGETWSKMAEVFHRKGLLSLDEGNAKVGVVNKIQRSPVDPQLVIFLGTEGVNWISPDCGATVNAIGLTRQMREFQFHPTDANLILASAWSKCPNLNEPNTPCFVTKDLMLS